MAKMFFLIMSFFKDFCLGIDEDLPDLFSFVLFEVGLDLERDILVISLFKLQDSMGKLSFYVKCSRVFCLRKCS